MTRITTGEGKPNAKDLFVESNLGGGDAFRVLVIVRRKETPECIKMVTEHLVAGLHLLKQNGLDIEYEIDGKKEVFHYKFGFDLCQAR